MIQLHYVYLHTTLSGDIPFYIGIGTKQYRDHKNLKMKYARAYSLNGRTNFWKRVVSKYDYKIDILLESSDYNYIKEQEIYFIKKYGRRNLGEGTLVNLTDGGEGSKNIVYTEENLANMRKGQKNSYLIGTSVLCRPGFYDGLSERMKGNQHAKGTTLSEKNKKNLIEKRIEKLSKRVIQEDLEGNFIKEWYTTVEAANYFGITYKAIWKACNQYHKGSTSQSFRWKFKE